MAILNGIEGQARVEVEGDDANWNGYILLEPILGNIRYFDIAGPTSQGIYEGPILRKGTYYFVNGKVKIIGIDWTSNEDGTPKNIKIDFRGIERLNVVKTYQKRPPDFLSLSF